MLAPTASAGSRVWRAVRVDIWPSEHNVRWAVSARQSKGTDLVWKRELCTAGIDLGAEGRMETNEQLFRAVAAALLEIADDVSRQ